MKLTAAATATFLLLQVISIATDDTNVKCSNGELVESEHLCNTTNTTANCNGSYCMKNESSGRKCPKCLQKTLTVREAFLKAHFAVSAKIISTRRVGVYYVELKTVVRLVMKSTSGFLTPGRLLLVIPLDPDWQCDCPGVYDAFIGETYFITGVVESVNTSLIPVGYVLKVDHKSLITPWKETIVEDMVKNKEAYPRLTLRPSWHVYKLIRDLNS